MPELPEVESLRRSLIPLIIGKKVLEVKVLLPKIVSSYGTRRVPNLKKVSVFENSVKNKTIRELHRRGKNLILEFEDGSLVLIHLKMTGQLAYDSGNRIVVGGHPIEVSHQSLPNSHTRVILRLDHGILYYNDVRQFGYLLFFPSWQELKNAPHFNKIGVEPLGENFTVHKFSRLIKVRSTAIKKVLLQQELVAGIGNIYADESLFEAGILPQRPANSLSNKEIIKLHKSLIKILNKAIAEGGSSVANYLLADGSKGNFARFHKVYGRAQKNCFRCGAILKKTIIGSRSTVYCVKCQK